VSSIATAPAAKAQIDPKLIVPAMNSVKAVFETMVKVAVQIERPTIKATPGVSYDVSGIIGLSGDLTGSIVLSFPTASATKLVSAFAGCELDPKSPEFPDAVGELANMIAGGAKKAFGFRANISTPNVVIGAGHKIARLSDVPCVVIPCKTAMGDFAVEINIKQIGVAADANR